MPSRRSILGTAASLLAAGCSQRAGGGGTTTTRTTTSTTPPSTTTSDPIHVPTQLDWGSSTTYDGTAVTPNEAWRQHSVITLTTPDSFGVRDFPAKQLLFATISVDGADPRPTSADFAIEAGGNRYTGWTSYQGLEPYRFRVDNRSTAYDPTAAEPGGWIGFILPSELGAETPRLLVQFAGETEGATRWPLPDDVTTALNAPVPHIKLDKLEVPDAVPAGEPFDVTLTARNEGRGDGTFRAAVNEAGPQYMGHAVRLPVPAGATRTTTQPVVVPRGSDVSSMTLRIVTLRGTVERNVTIE